MATPADVRCDSCNGDQSELRLTITETVWYLLDVTEEGLYPEQPETAGEPILQLVCLACGHEGTLRPEVRALLRFE